MRSLAKRITQTVRCARALTSAGIQGFFSNHADLVVWLRPHLIEKLLFHDLAVFDGIESRFVHLYSLTLRRASLGRNLILEEDDETVTMRKRPSHLSTMNVMVLNPPLGLRPDGFNALDALGEVRIGYGFDADNIRRVECLDGLEVLALTAKIDEFTSDFESVHMLSRSSGLLSLPPQATFIPISLATHKERGRLISDVLAAGFSCKNCWTRPLDS